MRKTFKKMALVVAFALVLALGAAVPAFAAEPLPMTTTLTKNLVMPAGVTVPASGLTFQFNFASQGTGADAAPAIPQQSITIPAGATSTTNNVQNLNLATILQGLASQVPNAGSRDWIVTEVIPVPPKDDVTYDTTQFRLRAHFRNADPGPGTELAAVEVFRITPGTPPTEEKVMDDSFGFVNLFTPDAGEPPNGDPEVPAAVITKTVTGDRVAANLSTLFNFSATLTAPTLPAVPPHAAQTVPLPSPLVATIVDEAGNPITDRASAVTFTAGTASFQLRDGESLRIPPIPAGTTMSVTETLVATDRFTPTITVTEGGTGRTPQVGTEGTTITTTPAVLLHNVNATAPLTPVNNTAAFANSYRDVPPTGIVVANLPIVGVVAVVAVLVSLMLVRNRKRIEELPVS